MNRRSWLVMALMMSSFSCQKSPETQATIEPGMWRAVVTLPGGELPFQMEVVSLDGPGVHAYVINGKERVPVTEFKITDNTLNIEFPAFNNRLRASLQDGVLSGELELVKRHGELQRMPLVLEQGRQHRFFAQAPDVNADFGGRWSVNFVDDDGDQTEAVADFEQVNGKVTGTFRTPTGDYRFLAGEVDNRTLYLSTFDGAHAFLFEATMDKAGKLQGDFWSGTKWHESWTAVRNSQAALPDPNQLTLISKPTDSFVIEFPDTSGTLVRSDAEKFQGKVVIVALAGSWCPNCHDEAAFLAPFYRTYRSRGLEVLGLMYEHLDEFSDAAKQVEKFREKFGIEYTLLIGGGSDKAKASETLPMLNKVIAYPTMIVLDRNAEVRLIHTGFNGPGTGEKYDEFRHEFTQLIEQLLNEEQG